MIELNGHLAVLLSYPSEEKLGNQLSNLTSCVITLVATIVLCILNLLLLIWMMLMKLVELLVNIVQRVWNALSILCRLAVARKGTTSRYRRWRNSAWNGGGGSRQDSILAYSEMPGALKENLDSIPKGIKSEEEYEKIRKMM